MGLSQNRYFPIFHIHFNCILIPKQSFSQGSVESFHNRLVSVYLSAPTANSSFVILHNFSYSSHKLTPRVNLQ